jgi:flagellar hook-associated protein 2
MSITSSTGLVSGIDTASLIDQLIALDARPVTLIEARNATLTAQQAAFQELNSSLVTMKLSADKLANINTFRSTTVASSNESVMSATSKSSAVPGTYDFVVSQLVATQQMVTSGFADKDVSPVSATGGSFTFEFGDGGLTTNTDLSKINGGDGFARGKIRITDRTGTTEIIDLSTATTVNDVLDAINNSTNVSVTASVQGDKFVIEDNTGATASNLIVADQGTTGSATSLGLVSSVASDTINGQNVNTIGTGSLLADLNDGNGVRFKTAADMQIALRDGSTVSVNFSDEKSIGDILDTINAAGGGNLTASVNSVGTGLQIQDLTSGGNTTQVTALNNSNAAADLGLLRSDIDNDGTIGGDRVIAALNSKLLKSLRGGQGVTQTYALAPQVLDGSTLLSSFFNGAGLSTSGNATPDIKVSPKNTPTVTNLDIDTATTVQDLIDLFDTKFGGALTISIEGTSLRLTDNTGGTQNFIFNNYTSSDIAGELGFGPGVIGTTTVLGNDVNPARLPTQDYGPGQMSITNSAGITTEVDLSAARSVSDLIETLNNSGAGIEVSLNNAGNGLIINDTAGGGGDLTIADVGGSIASELNIAGTYSSGQAGTGDLDVQYISESTKLDNLRNGLGVTRGKFIVSDSAGKSATIDLTQGDEITIGDVLNEINSKGLKLTARINDTGDGILLEDTGPGVVAISVEEKGSTTAKSLGLLGAAANAGDDLDGTFEKTITIDAADTLQDVVDKITDSGIDIKASIINDGSTNNPYRLNLLAAKSGKSGAFIFDDGGLGLTNQNLVEAKNAKVFFGSSDPAKGVAITSTSNTISSVVPGVTINLKGASNASVRLVVERDNTAVSDSVNAFVENFNAVIEIINTYDAYDSETQTRGLLLGDSTLSRVNQSLYNLVNHRNTDVSGQYNTLTQVGIKIDSGGAISFDSAKFVAALENDRDAVEKLFSLRTVVTDEDTYERTVTASGFGYDFSELLNRLTDTDGTLQSKLDSISNQMSLNNDRIEQLNDLLADKRSRLQSQFNAMELALSELQSQSSSLNTLANLASNSGSSN